MGMCAEIVLLSAKLVGVRPPTVPDVQMATKAQKVNVLVYVLLILLTLAASVYHVMLVVMVVR